MNDNTLFNSDSAEITGEDEKYFQFTQGSIHGLYEKSTGQIYYNSDDIVRALGMGDNLNAFLSSDKGLDFLAQWQKENPGKTVEKDMTIKDLLIAKFVCR